MRLYKELLWCGPALPGSHCFYGVEAEIDMTKKGLFWISFLIIALLLPGCSRQPAEFQIYAMDTVMTVKLWGSGGEEAGQDLARAVSGTGGAAVCHPAGFSHQPPE